MGKAVVGTCDYEACEYVGDVASVQLILDGTEWVGDLCPTHVEPLENLLQHIKKRKAAAQDKVWTMEEIEALKRDL